MSAKTLKVQQQQQQMDRAGAGIKSKMIKADAFDSFIQEKLESAESASDPSSEDEIVRHVY